MSSYEALKRPLKEAGTVTVRSERRRRWSVEDKLAIVRETLAPDAVIKVVAERHGISTGLLFTWRKQMLRTAMNGFVAVQVAAEETAMLPTPCIASEPAESPAEAAVPRGMIDLEWPSGARVRVAYGADPTLLQCVLAALDRH